MLQQDPEVNYEDMRDLSLGVKHPTMVRVNDKEIIVMQLRDVITVRDVSTALKLRQACDDFIYRNTAK